MTPYEFWTPVVLLALAGLAVLALHFAEKRLDARLEAARLDVAGSKATPRARHPAE